MSETRLSRLFAGDRFECPFCGGRFSRFLPFGDDLSAFKEKRVVGAGHRPNALCPQCLSLDRERLVYLYLKTKTGVFRDQTRLLHVAPEKNLKRLLEASPNIDYAAADSVSPLARVKMDVTRIPYAADSFDVIICNHVLEHVQDDRRAMAELYRVLKPAGCAILQVPVSMLLDETCEESAVDTPKERERLFGQSDHVRIYARDYKERLEEAGFGVELYNFAEEMGESFSARWGLIKEENLYVGSKPA
jgi:predicted SAM-dependent methyltransferase